MCKVAIIGFGPKGLYGLERLLAEYQSAGLDRPLDIHIYNLTPHFACGDIYMTDQPSYLLMNYANEHINMWRTGEPPAIVTGTLSFIEYLSQREGRSEEDLKGKYASRHLVGEYLVDGYHSLIEALPETISIHEHVAKVYDLEPGDEGTLTIHTKEGGDVKATSGFKKILLSTGYPRAEEDVYGNYVRHVYPVNKNLKRMPPGREIAIKGLGLTFIDAVIALTEGRGGRFNTQADGKLEYLPSGNEPGLIYGYSRTGLPMIPRNGTSSMDRELKYFKIPPGHEQLIWNEDIYPMLDLEATEAYYRVKFREHGLAWQQNLEDSMDYFHEQHPAEERFSLSHLLFPQPWLYNTHDDHVGYLQSLVKEAEKPTGESALIAAADTWRLVGPLFGQIYCSNQITPLSRKHFDENIRGQLNRITYGPALINAKKILALERYGLLNFSHARNPEVYYLTSKGCYEINYHTHADYLINGRVPRHDMDEGIDDLYSHMIERRVMTAMSYLLENEDTFEPGCMNMDEHGHPLDEKHKPDERVTLYGTPTEGFTYDNDTLSRDRNDFSVSWANEIIEILRKPSHEYA